MREVLEDFHWLVKQPPLLSLPEHLDGHRWLLGLSELRENSLAGAAELVEPCYKLGFYYERLCGALFQVHPEVEVLAHNLQVKGATRTLGEFDFLLKVAERWIHLECAIKFYLLERPNGSIEDFIGPDRRDRLVTKRDHLLNHQSRLSSTDEGLAAARSVGVDGFLQPMVLVQGYLFLPYSSTVIHPSEWMPEIDATAVLGWWVCRSQVELIAEDGIYYQLLEKPNWLSGQLTGQVGMFGFAELELLLQDPSKYPVFLCRIQQREGGWKELDRGFVVSDDWRE